MDDVFRDELDFEREYSPSSVAPDFARSVAAYRTGSDAALTQLPWRRLPYGPDAEQIVLLCGDLRDGGHVHLFIHGGYWQELSWRDALFPAPAFVERGMAYGAIGYRLAPAATLDDIVADCRDAIGAVTQAIRREGIEVRLSVSGSSAGAHLAAVMATTDWSRTDLGRNPISALILISGIYALRPLVRTSINAALQLDEQSADRLSPLLQPVPSVCPALIAWGEYETSAFKRQSIAFADRWRGGPNPVATMEVAGRSHFDILFDLSDDATALGRRVFDLLEGDLQLS